jgi:hypothetical protein
MRRVGVVLLLAGAAFADTSPPSRAIVETRWPDGALVIASNDKLTVKEGTGDTPAVCIAGGGESCILRRARFTLRLPCRVRFRLRWTEAQYGNAYPSAHVVFDPPDVKDAWWDEPIAGGPGAGTWAGDRTSVLFHFATDANWRRCGLSTSLEQGPQRHAYSPPKGGWIALELSLEASRVTVRADGKDVAAFDADLRSFKTFTWAVGDQTSTRVELDEVRILPGK